MSGIGIDIDLFRKNPDIYRESQRRRNETELVPQIEAIDDQWRRARGVLDGMNAEYKRASKAIGMKKKAREECDELVAEQKQRNELIVAKKRELAELDQERARAMNKLGALVSDRSAISDTEEGNVTLRTWDDKIRREEGLLSHVDLMYMAGLIETSQATSISGGRAYFLVGPGLMLSNALTNFALDFQIRRGYTPIQTPYFMTQSAMSRCAQLEQFDEELYKVSMMSRSGAQQDEDRYLIATSEQPISALHHDQRIDPATLPFRYAGYSTNFRKEVGSHGRDTSGIFRVHQFDKVEQFCVTDPEKSYEMFDEMSHNSEEFFKQLGIAYRVVNIASGALNNAAALKYDLEGYFPSSGVYRELCSCSNCLDYQSRKLNTRYGLSATKEKKFVHMLNATLCAVQRTLCCIVETYQTPTGIRVPEALRPFMLGGLDFIPFRHTLEDVRKPGFEKRFRAFAAPPRAAEPAAEPAPQDP